MKILQSRQPHRSKKEKNMSRQFAKRRMGDAWAESRSKAQDILQEVKRGNMAKAREDFGDWKAGPAEMEAFVKARWALNLAGLLSPSPTKGLLY